MRARAYVCACVCAAAGGRERLEQRRLQLVLRPAVLPGLAACNLERAGNTDITEGWVENEEYTYIKHFCRRVAFE